MSMQIYADRVESGEARIGFIVVHIKRDGRYRVADAV